MSQDYKVIDDEQTLKDSLPDLNANFATIASNFSGTDFPTNNLVEGMTCYRTDEQKVYRYRSTGEDTFDWKLVEDLNKNFATVATSGKYDDLTNKPEIATQAEAEAGTNNSRVMTPLRTKQAIDVNAKYIVGEVRTFAFAIPPVGWLVCDGSFVSRTTYSALFSAIGTTFGEWPGDTEVFRLPNLTDNRFIEGGTSVGTNRDAGLPNITAYMSDIFIDKNWDYSTMTKGAVRLGLDYSSPSCDWYPYSGTGRTEGGTVSWDFDASWSSAVYGKSTTVQPKSLTLLPCIKY